MEKIFSYCIKIMTFEFRMFNEEHKIILNFEATFNFNAKEKSVD